MTLSALTQQHFRRAAQAGTLHGDGVARGSAGSAGQGTRVEFHWRVTRTAHEAPRIVEARFLAFGCPHVIAVADWLAAAAVGGVAGPDLPEPVAMLQRRFDVPIEKRGRLLVIEDAWQATAQAAAALQPER